MWISSWAEGQERPYLKAGDLRGRNGISRGVVQHESALRRQGGCFKKTSQKCGCQLYLLSAGIETD